MWEVDLFKTFACNTDIYFWEAHLTSKMETLWPLKQNPAIQFAVSVGFDYSVPNGLYNPGLLYKHAVEGSLAVERWGTLDMWINH